MRVIVGRPDREMEAIESLARELGIKVVWATLTGARQRVSASTSYDAIHPQPKPGDLWVECRPQGLTQKQLEQLGCVVIDHHQPGDPGCTVLPEQFLNGSSLGQFLQAVARQGIEPWPVEETWPAQARISAGTLWEEDGIWYLATQAGYCCVPEEIIYIAAADHCLAAALIGRCPGVDPMILQGDRPDYWVVEKTTPSEVRFWTEQGEERRGIIGDPTGEAVQVFLDTVTHHHFSGSPARGFVIVF